MYSPLRSSRLYVGIVDQITQSVLTGQMKPGDQLPTENELADQFGVSRTVVREAIKALSLQGLVEVTPGRGTFITQPPIDTIINSFELGLKLADHSSDDLIFARRLLELPIARLAAEKAQPENVEALAATLQGMRDNVGKVEAFIDYDTSFHAELARATQNTVLCVLIQPIIHMLQASREIAAGVPGMSERALSYHEQLYQAVVARDGVAAEQVMSEHIAQVAKDTAYAREVGLLDDQTL